MKHILIIINNMHIGGIQKSLVEFLKALAQRDDLSVSLFCCLHSGEFLEKIPENITLLPANKWAAVAELTVGDCKKLGLRYYLFRLLASAWAKVFHKALPAKLLCCKIGNLGTYDVAISYSQPIHEKAFCTLTNEIALNCCKAAKKVTFVHCDYADYGGNTPQNRKLYKQFDTIAAVSNSVGRALGDAIPEVRDKIKTVYNFCDVDEIKTLANQSPVIYSVKTLVTVARLSGEKGLLRCIPIMAKLKEQGLNFEWHIIGGGGLEPLLRQAIEAHGLQKTVILEGQQTNPYRYMKHADSLFLPSFHEAAPVVFDEAIALGLPILTTETLSAKELVLGRQAGTVCENNENAIYDMLYKVLMAPTRQPMGVSLDMRVNMAQFDAICRRETEA